MQNTLAFNVDDNVISDKPAKIIKLFDNNSADFVADKRPPNIPHRAESIKSLDDINLISNYFLENGQYRDYMMFILGICSGLRISDLCSLNVIDVLNEDMTYKDSIDIVEKKTGKKSCNSEDKCLITPAMRYALDIYFSHHKIKSLYEPLLYSRKVSENGEHRITTDTGWRVMKAAQRDLGIKYNIGSHSMRKTFANIAACVGDSNNLDMSKLLQVQHMLKHGDYKTTMRYLNLNSVFTSKARHDVSDFVLGKTDINDLTEALYKSEDNVDNKLDTILSLLDKIIDITEAE